MPAPNDEQPKSPAMEALRAAVEASGRDDDFIKFGDLPREKQIALFNAWLEGNAFEAAERPRRWATCPNPMWEPELAYRFKATTPSIDWKHVAPEWKFMARDADGKSWLFDCEPTCHESQWEGEDVITPAEPFSSFRPGTCNWKDSLVERDE